MQNKYIYRFLILVTLLASLVGCGEDDEDYTTYKDGFSTLYSFLEDNQEYSYFKAIVDTTRLKDSGQSMSSVYSSYNSNSGGNRYTLFLPTNNAIEEFLVEENTTLDELLASEEDCWKFATHHLVNTRVYSSEFPNGEMPDSSLNGASHVIRYMNTDEGVSYLIDETASIVYPDLNQSNGVIHVIDKVLVPLSLTSCEWLEEDGDYDIFVDALKLTGLDSVFQNVDTKFYPFTMFVESDAVFISEGISSITDLIARFSPDDDNYTDPNNLLYQFVAYHALDSKALYITDMEDGQTSYDTFTSYPLAITLSSGLSSSTEFSDGIGINVGHIIYDTITSVDKDTIFVDYISMYETASNTPTLSGVIHFVNHILEVNTDVTATTKKFDFHEDPFISDLYNNGELNRRYTITDDELERFSFGGDLYEINYSRVEDDADRASLNDYLIVAGNYEISFTTTKISVGDYDLQLNVDVPYTSGLIDVYLDGKRLGTTVNLSALEVTNANYSYNLLTVARVTLTEYKEHVVTLKAITPGNIKWDFIQFTP